MYVVGGSLRFSNINILTSTLVVHFPKDFSSFHPLTDFYFSVSEGGFIYAQNLTEFHINGGTIKSITANNSAALSIINSNNVNITGVSVEFCECTATNATGIFFLLSKITHALPIYELCDLFL